MARLFNKIQGLLRPQGEDDSAYSALLDLPLDIFWLIFSLLPLESKACLALTCKPLYSAFGFVLNDEHLAWPRPRVLRSVRFRRQSWIWGPRTDFLRLLESDRWLYCSGCLKLHPPTRFRKDSGRIPHRWRLCKLKAHVVDLCPCLAVNFADRMRLIESLQTGCCSPDLAPSIRQALQPQFTNGKRLFNHSCSVESDVDAVVTLEMTLTLDGDKCLQASTRHHVQWTKDPNAAIYVLSPMFYEPEPVLLCPHIDILAYTRPVPLSQMGRCQHCDTRLQITERSDNDSYYVIDGVRNLGRAWDTNCHKWDMDSMRHYCKCPSPCLQHTYSRFLTREGEYPPRGRWHWSLLWLRRPSNYPRTSKREAFYRFLRLGRVE